MNVVSRIAFFLFTIILVAGCEGFFGKKTDTDFLDVPIYNDKAVAYVPVQPVWSGFIEPVDIIAGYDELIYVADAGTDEIISFDQAGNELGRFFVPGIRKIAQDRSLDLLAIGSTDTLGYSLSTLYRIGLKNAAYGLNGAVIKKKFIHPFYYRVAPPANLSEASVQFMGIGLRADNSYYLTRTGPSNSPLQFGGPDNAVLLFNSSDTYITPINISTITGVYSDYFKAPGAIGTLAQPPQSPFVNTTGDFVIVQDDENVALRIQYIFAEESDGGISYSVRNLETGDTSKADRFLYEPYRFANPKSMAISGDGTSYLFVVDGEKDSLFQFTLTGLEGVKAPAGSSSTKNIRVSFGGNGQGLTQFDRPSGVAYLNRVVYVADAGNGRVLRFRLTTDFD